MVRCIRSGHIRVLITGATGFIGRRLLRRLEGADFEVIAVGRKNAGDAAVRSFRYIQLTDDFADVDWSGLVRDVDCVVHLAGLAHGRAGAARYRARRWRFNAELPGLIAQACVNQGVGRLVFLSSASVYGGPGHDGVIYAETPVSPRSEYGRQKVFAEDEIRRIVGQSSVTRAIVLRPPMVYGPSAPGNFSRLSLLLKYGLPLPRGLAGVKRSFIFSDNLSDLIVHCIRTECTQSYAHYLATDGPVVDLQSFIVRMSNALRKPRFWLPIGACRLLAKIPILSGKLGPLISNFVMDSSSTERDLSWRPPYSWEEGLSLSFSKTDETANESSA